MPSSRVDLLHATSYKPVSDYFDNLSIYMNCLLMYYLRDFVALLFVPLLLTPCAFVMWYLSEVLMPKFNPIHACRLNNNCCVVGLCRLLPVLFSLL